jgi:transposase
VTSDALLSDLEALEELERRKRGLQPDDPQLVDTARQVETIARRLLGQSVRQRELTSVVSDMTQAGHPDAPQQTIDATPREIHQILADWREAERRARAVPDGSAEAKAASADIERLREEYRAAHDSARRKR